MPVSLSLKSPTASHSFPYLLMSETPSRFTLTPGQKAPDFTLPNILTGEKITLSTHKGQRGTLIVFACNHCPYVILIAKTLGALAKKSAENGIQTLAINANDIKNYPADNPLYMPKFAQEHGWDFPYLFDENQEIARSYDAACTPDFFLLDSDCRLFYAGQFDTSRPSNEIPPTGDSLQKALNALLTGEKAPQPFIPAVGCNIKWKP